MNKTPELTGKHLPLKSWEKQSVYSLSNGWTATVGYSMHYGEHVTRLDSPNGLYWHCSTSPASFEILKTNIPNYKGIKNLPGFAECWRRGGSGPAKDLVRPGFKRTF